MIKWYFKERETDLCSRQHHVIATVMAPYLLFSILGACLEDKVFPKTNSLHEGRAQPLADVNEFALKIKVSSIHC